MKTTFIYALCEPGTRSLRYIGKADFPKRRLEEHLIDCSKVATHRGYWISSLVTRGLRPELIILREVSDANWQATEKNYIRVAKRLGIRLVNSTDGGDGCCGCVRSEETRMKLRESHLGKTPTAETRKRMSDALSGEKNPNFGKKAPAETLSKLRTSHLGFRPSEETRKKLRNRRLSPKAKQNLRDKNSGSRNPFFGRKHTEESKAKFRATLAAKE